MNIQSAVKEGINILKNNCIKTAVLDTEILLAKVLGSNREYIMLNDNKNLDDDNLDHFKKLIKERASRKPIAYLLNKKFFWDSEFYVDKNTLIPRPDTEIIIEEILRLTKYKNKINILDIWGWIRVYSFNYFKRKKKFLWNRNRYIQKITRYI